MGNNDPLMAATANRDDRTDSCRVRWLSLSRPRQEPDEEPAYVGDPLLDWSSGDDAPASQPGQP